MDPIPLEIVDRQIQPHHSHRKKFYQRNVYGDCRCTQEHARSLIHLHASLKFPAQLFGIELAFLPPRSVSPLIGFSVILLTWSYSNIDQPGVEIKLIDQVHD